MARGKQTNPETEGNMAAVRAATEGAGDGAGNGLDPKADFKEDAVPPANVVHFNSQVQVGFNELYDIEKKIEAQVAAYVTPFKKERLKRWRTLKADTNISRKALELEYKRYAYARDARNGAKEGEFDRVVGELVAVHRALYPGSTLDIVAALDRRDSLAA